MTEKPKKGLTLETASAAEVAMCTSGRRGKKKKKRTRDRCSDVVLVGGFKFFGLYVLAGGRPA